MITQKTPEQLQAQLAIYASSIENITNNGRAETLLANLGRVTLYDEPPDLVTVDEIPFIPMYAVGIGAEPLFDREEYKRSFLESVNHEARKNLATMIRAYGDFRADIEETGILREDQNHLFRHRNYIGSGRDNFAFSFSHETAGEVTEYVALVPKHHPDFSAAAKMNRRAVALARVKGMRGVEQGIAVSYDPMVIIVSKAAGKLVGSLSAKEISTISSDHQDKLFKYAEDLSKRDISIDANPDNYFYDSKEGFTVIDFETNFYFGKPSDLMNSNRNSVKSFGFRDRRF